MSLIHRKYWLWIRQQTDIWMAIGISSVLLMFAVNLVDVVGSKFLRKPFPGATEFVSYFQVVAISCAIAGALVAGRHVKVEFFLDRMKRGPRVFIVKTMRVAELAFAGIVVFEGLRFAESLRISGEKGVSSNLPLYPFAYVMALSFIPVCVYFLHRTVRE